MVIIKIRVTGGRKIEKISSGKYFYYVLCLSETKGMDIKMKRGYKILITILALEIVGVSALNELGMVAHSWIGNVISGMIFLVPLLILLYFLSKDSNISRTKRTLSKIVLCFIIICFCVGMIAKAIALEII